MNKTYKAKQIKNLHDLHLEQARVRQAYKSIEHNAMASVISPDVILPFVLNKIIVPKIINKTPRSSNSLLNRFSKRKKSSRPPAAVSSFSTKPNTTKKSYKKLGRLLLVWQATSLCLFIGVHTFRYFQKRKAEKRIRN